MNLEELKEVFKEASLGHELINSFQVGNNYNIAENNALDHYPVAFYELPYSINSNLEKGVDEVQFAFNIFLLSKPDNINEDHMAISKAKVIGDTILDYIMDNNTDFYISAINSVSVREFSDDNVSGMRYDLTIMMKNLVCENEA